MFKRRLKLSVKISLLSGIFVFFTLPFVFAANEQATPKQEEVRQEVFSRQVEGEVGGISANFIAINYGQNEKELLQQALSMDKSTKGGRRRLSEIKVGDIVSVTYEETVETKKGGKPRVIKRLAKFVEFRRAGNVSATEGNVLESK